MAGRVLRANGVPSVVGGNDNGMGNQEEYLNNLENSLECTPIEDIAIMTAEAKEEEIQEGELNTEEFSIILIELTTYYSGRGWCLGDDYNIRRVGEDGEVEPLSGDSSEEDILSDGEEGGEEESLSGDWSDEDILSEGDEGEDSSVEGDQVLEEGGAMAPSV